ncbi:uncharacterized protein C18orf19 homolog A [Drosophila serrata]|uniref:uncharacterized protein C18orf19 homolog A n=1 Tax=Drosophila serrata TaxID=7274 RepID=UPI000A1D0888|nr:uncharacterized protein C18orf19 homolog A [Drosophila serrata]KAH8373646.1 hypothetical protein KR200_000294 [Drosophila serrata]
MATVALITRQRMFASSLRLFSGRHTHCLAALPRIATASPPSSIVGSGFSSVGTTDQRGLLLPLQLQRHNHKSSATTTTSTTTSHSTDEEKNAKATATSSTDLFGEAANMSLMSKFKHMYKKYWYVLIPVHVVTSLGWFGGFYYLSKSGVDVPALLQYLHLSENIIQKVQSSHMGHYAIAYLCYKVATPLRYALTLGCTTISIKHLVLHGYIKPMPTKDQLIKMYEDKKAIRASAKADKAEKDETK